MAVSDSLYLRAGQVTLDYFAVYDGHGGKQAATFASRHLLDTLLDGLGTLDSPAPVRLFPGISGQNNCAEVFKSMPLMQLTASPL